MESCNIILEIVARESKQEEEIKSIRIAETKAAKERGRNFPGTVAVQKVETGGAL